MKKFEGESSVLDKSLRKEAGLMQFLKITYNLIRSEKKKAMVIQMWTFQAVHIAFAKAKKKRKIFWRIQSSVVSSQLVLIIEITAGRQIQIKPVLQSQKEQFILLGRNTQDSLQLVEQESGSRNRDLGVFVTKGRGRRLARK